MDSGIKIRIGICDDSLLERGEIIRHVRDILGSENIEHDIQEYESGDVLLHNMERGENYDIFLLDVMMDGMNGMELASALRARQNKSAIIFISNNREMAMCGYEVEAVRYLSKPVNAERLREALLYCVKNIENKRPIQIPTLKGEYRLSLSEVLYVEAQGRGTKIVLVNGETDCKLNISTLESMLPSGFIRCHQGFLANLAHIRFVRRNELEMSTGMTVPISKYRYQEVMTRFVRYLAE